MAFNTTSYLAGVGSVVVVLSTGFAGGYFFASPDQNPPPNRLQRVAADATETKTADAKAPSTKAPQAKPAVAAAVVAPAQAEPAPPSTTQPPAAQSSAPAVAAAVSAVPTQQPAVEQSAPPAPHVATETPEPARAMHEQTTTQAAPEKTNADKLSSEKEKADRERARIAEAKASARKRAEARKLAEEQRKQHELEVAAGAVRHIIHDSDDGGETFVRDAPSADVVEIDQAEPSRPAVRPFDFFGR